MKHDGGNVRSFGPFYVTSCPRYPSRYHTTGLVFFPQTREYEWPFRYGRGLGLRLPKLVIARGGDGFLWFRVTSRVRVLGVWGSNKKRKAYDDDQGALWAIKGRPAELEEISLEDNAAEEWVVRSNS